MSEETTKAPRKTIRRSINTRKSPLQNRDRWILSYADFITLMFAFFVALYSISLKNDGDKEKMNETLIGVFETVQKSIKPISMGTPSTGGEQDKESADAGVLSPVSTPARSEENPPDRSTESALYKSLNQIISTQFSTLQESGQVSISESKNWINLELKSGLLFGEGEYELSNEAVALLIVIANVLKSYPSPVLVDGNTDNLPVASKRLISNWHLSSLRASSVVDELVYRGVNPKLIAPIGFSSEHPKVMNTNQYARQQNRRVTLRISKEQTDNLYDYLFK